MSSEGHIVNIYHSGNRVADMIYGPKKIIIIVDKYLLIIYHIN
ncbi:MAG: lactate utilization protein, partial [bacterium]